MKNVFALFAGLLLLCFCACKKQQSDNNSTSTTTTTTTSSGYNMSNAEIPNQASDGVTFINNGTSAIFNLFAPGKTSVSVIGDFNNWVPTTMKKTSDSSRWYVQIDNLNPTTVYSYQYFIDNTIKVADPYTQLVLDPANDPKISSTVYTSMPIYPTGKTTGLVSAMQGTPVAYTWKNASITRPDKNKLVVYELLVRDFVATHSYKTLTDTLNYLVNLGVNAVELLPINEFEGNDSWGYNPNFCFALDKYYGSKNDYKAFIDACHSKGIAVIQDFVLEDQYGSSPLVTMWADANGAPLASNPYMDPLTLHPNGVGYQMNHQSAATQYFAKNVMKYWMQEYHIDGYRFDQASGYTQTASTTTAAWNAYDASRIAIWTTYNNYMKSLDPTFYVVLEYFAVNAELNAITNQGMMIWGDLNGAGSQAVLGNIADLSGLSYSQYGYTSPTGLMGYFESHDDERVQYNNSQSGNSSGTYNIKDLATGLQRDEMGATLMFAAPGPKMFWQFGELGYDISINQNGRTGDKPILWNYYSVAARAHLHDVYANMIKWKIKNDVFTTGTFTYSLNGYIKSIRLSGSSNNVVVVGNFDVNSQSAIVSFPVVGTWYDNISGNSINVTTTSYSVTFAPGEYHVYSTTKLSQ